MQYSLEAQLQQERYSNLIPWNLNIRNLSFLLFTCLTHGLIWRDVRALRASISDEPVMLPICLSENPAFLASSKVSVGMESLPKAKRCH